MENNIKDHGCDYLEKKHNFNTCSAWIIFPWLKKKLVPSTT